MPDLPISGLPDGGDPQNTDDFVVARGATNNKIAWSSMSNALATQQVVIAASNTTYTSGTVELTGVGGGVTVGSNAGQQVEISVAAPVAQSVQTQNVVDVTLSGNTSGVLALVSSGTMTLAGGNNITLSQVGNAITISGASIPAESQSFIGGISASDTLYTSGSVRFSGSQAATVRSGTGQLVIIDVPAQTTQVETQTFIAGISASDTLYTSGNVRFTGVGGGVTVSSNTGQRVDISVAAQSVQPETQTFIGGISASNTLYTSGSVRFTGSQAVTVRSGTGQLVVIDVPAQTTQVETQTFLGAIQNSQTTYTSGTVNLSVNGGLMTIRSTTGQAFQFSVSQSVQPETQTFIGGISASDTLYTSGSVRFTGSQAVTVRSGTGQLVVIDAPAQTVQTQDVLSVGVSTGGNTLGNTGVNTGSRLVIVGSNGITASQGTAAGATTITLSGITQSVQPETQTFLGAIGNSQTTYTSGTVNLSVNGGLLTIRSTTGQAFQFSVSQSVQPETQTAISGIANSQTTYTSGTVSLSELGAITIRSTTGNQFQFSVNAQTAQTGISGIANSQTTYTSGTVSLSELGAITIRSTTGNQYQFSVNSQTAQTQSNIQALYDGANSVTTGTVRLTDANGVTFSLNAQTLSASVNQSISMFAVSNTTQSTSGTAHKSALSFGGAGGVSVGVTGGSVVISGGAGAGMSVGVSTGGNSSGDTTVNSGSRLVFAGGNNITLSQGTAAGATTITISAPNLGAGAFSGGVSTGGNTAGATGITGTQLVLVGSGPISLSQTTGANGGTVTINAPAQTNQTGDVYASSNTFGTSSGTYDARSLSIAGSGGVSVAASNSGWVISAPAPQTAAAWENFPQLQASIATNVSQVTKTPFYWYENLPQGIKPANIAIRVSLVTANSDLSASVHFGIYTFVNSTSAALLGSASDAFVVSSASSVSFSSRRNLVLTSPGTVAAISSLTPGNYMFGMMFSATAGNAVNFQLYAASVVAGGVLGRIMPGTNQLSTGTSEGIHGLSGRGSTTVNALPANVVASEVVNQGTGTQVGLKPWMFIRS